MPKLPDKNTFGARPTPSTATFIPRLTGADTAGAEALREVAASIGVAGEVIDKVQDQRDQTRAEDAYNEILKRKVDLTIGEDGFTGKKSGDAANGDLIEDYGSRFQDAIGLLINRSINPHK